MVDDVGTVINQLTLQGQIHGGVAQGVGQAIGNLVYDPRAASSSPARSWITACRAPTTLRTSIASNPVPTKKKPARRQRRGRGRHGWRLPAIMNAVVDALAPLGIRHIDMPLTPERLWRAISQGKGERRRDYS